MRIYDVTRPVSPSLPVWPGDPPVVLERVASMERGDRLNLSHMACSVHIGTHVDAPLHFVAGAADVSSLPLDVLIGPVRLVELPDADAITAESLSHVDLEGVKRLLLKTRNGQLRQDEFDTGFVALTLDAAQWVIEHGVQLVGVDYLSVEPFEGDGSVHRALLGAGVIVVEGLDLRAVPPGDYTLTCLPLKLVGSDGAPARAALISE
jgi:arylformamidase